VLKCLSHRYEISSLFRNCKENKVILNIGQPDIKTPEAAMEAVKNIDIKYLNIVIQLVLKAIETNFCFINQQAYPSIQKISLFLE
jgi:hypothetical protein